MSVVNGDMNGSVLPLRGGGERHLLLCWSLERIGVLPWSETVCFVHLDPLGVPREQRGLVSLDDVHCGSNKGGALSLMAEESSGESGGYCGGYCVNECRFSQLPKLL